VGETALALLPRTDHNRVDGDGLRALPRSTKRNVQAVIVYALIVHARELLHALVFEGGAVHPAGRFAEALADAARLALQQEHLARRRRRLRLRQRAGRIRRVGGDAPLALPLGERTLA